MAPGRGAEIRTLSRLVAVALVVVALVAVACGNAPAASLRPTPAPATSAPDVSPSPVALSTPEATPAVTPTPSSDPGLDQLVGRVMMVGFQGPLTDSVVADWAAHRYGALLVVNLNHNGIAADAIRSEIARLRAASGTALLAATDEEGNGVCTDAGGIPCGSNSAADVARMSTAIGQLGFNINLAPVADVARGPNSIMWGRSYGTDPAADSAAVGAAVDGVHRAGLLATAKHFPGHGDTSLSSETRLPVLTQTRNELETVDWPPFRAAIAHRVDLVMVGHLAVSALDPGVPASISPATFAVLRGELGWNGVVISDDMEMGGVTGTVATPEAAVRFLVSGGDLVMVAHHLEVAAAVFAAIRTAVLEGRLPRSRLEEAARRVSALAASRP